MLFFLSDSFIGQQIEPHELKLHRVRVLTSGQTEWCLQISEQDLPVGVALDGFENLLVNNNLVRFALGRWLVSLHYKCRY